MTTAATTELLPCPFCGALPCVYELEDDHRGDYDWHAYCGNSDCPMDSVHTHGVRTKAEAIVAWNRRSPRITRALALLAAVESGEAVGAWQPIETAPKDGTEFLGWFYGSTVQIWWMGKGGMWGNGFWEGESPTHWTPIPAAPAAPGVEG